MALRQGLEALSQGLLRQADIGNRAYEDAAKKEAERRAETRQMAAERRALIAAEEAEIRANKEWAIREGIKAQTARDAAAELARVQGIARAEQIASAEKIAALGETGATNRTQMLIDGRADAAELIATARKDERAEDHQWALDAAIAKAKNEQQAKEFQARVDRAKEAEEHLSKLYEGMKDVDIQWDDKTQSYLSGGDYMDKIHRAQDRVEAAWRATGIEALMSERNINEGKFGFLEQSIVGVISLEAKDQQWKDIVTGLHSEKDSSDYKEALKAVEPFINRALEQSRIRMTTSEKDNIRDQVIRRLSTYGAEKDRGDADVKKSSSGEATASGFFEAQRVIDTLSELGDEELSDYLRLGSLAKAEAMPSGRGRFNPKQQAINSAKARDPHHLLSILKGIRGKGAYDKTIVENLINKLEMWIKNAENPSAQAIPDSVSEEALFTGVGGASPGMLNQGGGLISAIDERSYTPEAVNARWA